MRRCWMQGTMFLAQPKSSQTVRAAGTFSNTTGSSSCTALQQDTCHLLVSRVPLHAVLVTIRSSSKHPVMLLMQATMFLAPQTSQTVCAVGTYQANTGQSSCDDADAGYYVSAQPKRARPVLLEPSAETGPSSCTSAPAGYYVLCWSDYATACSPVTIKHPPVKLPVSC